MAQIGFPSLILILIVAFVIFGPTRLPEVGKAAGKTIKEFKDAMSDSNINKSEEVTIENEKTNK